MKFCKDCKHVLPSNVSGKVDTNARCAAFKSLPHPVTGEERQEFAQFAREQRRQCGEEAHKFEAAT